MDKFKTALQRGSRTSKPKNDRSSYFRMLLRTQMLTHRPNLFQFWNQPVPPEEVSTLMDGWAKDTSFVYQRFDSDSADQYIGDNFDESVLDAYRACGIPAMQADFFRYCALFNEGGIYVDADTANSGKLAAVIASVERGLLIKRQKKIANDFLFVRKARDPLFEKVITQAVENINGKISNNVWAVTGPGIMTQMHLNPEQTHWFNGFDILPVHQMRDVILFCWNLNYKSSEDDWRSALKDPEYSIFRAR